jgi:transcription elongation factor GreB
VERPRVVHGVSEAAAEGDRSENAEYIYGKRRLRQIDGRMRFLRRRLDAAVVVDPREKRGESEKVFFGATVVLEDEDGGQQEYKIVGEDEIETETRRISWRSPIGSKLIGRRVDDEVRVQTPSGLKVFTIVDVRYE